MLRTIRDKKNESGFTLVELMVVVAIIGILLVIGVPQYGKFQAKARQTEIKNQLGAVYTSETSFAAENQSFTACLGQIGFNRDGAKQYYWIGFNAIQSVCSPQAGRSCLEYQWLFNQVGFPNWAPPIAPAGAGLCTDIPGSTHFAANVAEGTATTRAIALASSLLIRANQAAAPQFTIFGGGQVNRGQPVDMWRIDETKQLANTQSGI